MKLLVLFLRNIASVAIECKLHVESFILADCRDVVFWIENYNIGVLLDISGSNLLLAYDVNKHGLRSLAVEFRDNALDVKNDFRNVLGNTRNCRKLMKNTVDLNIRYRITGKRTQKNPAKRVAESLTEASLKRLNYKCSARAVFAHFSGSNIGLLYLYHSKYNLLKNFWVKRMSLLY